MFIVYNFLGVQILTTTNESLAEWYAYIHDGYYDWKGATHYE